MGAYRKQARYLQTRQQLGLFGGHFGKGDLKVLAPASEYGLKQELGSAGGLVHAAVGQLVLLDHVQQVGLHVLLGVQRWVAPIVFGHAPYGADVAFLGALGKAALDHWRRACVGVVQS